MALSEFDVITRYFDRDVRRDHVALGIGDDGAILRPPANSDLVSVTDTLVAAVHFPSNAAPDDIGYKSLAVNLSDIAAMGAEPMWSSLALTLPVVEEVWLQRFSAGFFELAAAHDVSLVGGDLSRGPLTVTVHVIGALPTGSALRRDAAQIDDGIYVTGTLGDANIGLALAQEPKDLEISASHRAYLLQRLQRPEPRVAVGRGLLTLASSAIDVSDGLVADLQHILNLSGVGAHIDLPSVPLSQALRAGCGEQTGLLAALHGGDDYELCFTAPTACARAINELAAELDCTVTRIGTIVERPGLVGRDAEGRENVLEADGYRHF